MTVTALSFIIAENQKSDFWARISEILKVALPVLN
jgi:hypothetical protein